VKTRLPIGNLLEDPLIDILDSLVGEPAYEAITMGHPERMGLAYGWSEARFIERSATTRTWHEEDGPLYSFFGATPDAWIGKLWPRGRAWQNGLSTATLADNFCNRWSGGLGFLRHAYNGSEVSIEPDGSVYPCCVKTRLPIGNLLEDPLIDILDSLVGEPAYEAITMGHPERMGLAYGWSEARFIERSATTMPTGRPYRNLCIGCDRFHEDVLGPVLEAARERRRAKRAASNASSAGSDARLHDVVPIVEGD